MIAQGGTAVGTGLNTWEGFDKEIADELSNITKMKLIPNPNKFESLASHDVFSS